MALCGPDTIGIVGLSGMALAPGIKQGIGGAAVKTLRTMPGLQNAQVGNAAQIEHGQLGMAAVGAAVGVIVAVPVLVLVSYACSHSAW